LPALLTCAPPHRSRCCGAPADESTDSSGPPDLTTSTSSSTASASASTASADPTTGDITGAAGCAELPLCDGFEAVAAGGPPDPALWAVTSPNCSGTGTLAIDGDVAHTGAASRRSGDCDHVFAAHAAALDVLGPVVYGRVWLRLGAALGPGHVTFLTLHAADSGGKDLRMGGQSEILMWNRESDDATLPALSPAGIALSVAPAADAWTCIEFMIDEAAGTLTTWVDDVAVAGLAVDPAPTPDVDPQWHQKPDWRPALADFKLGWESYAGQTMTLHIDDVALAGERIGCAP
jgi:hypothetical protein